MGKPGTCEEGSGTFAITCEREARKSFAIQAKIVHVAFRGRQHRESQRREREDWESEEIQMKCASMMLLIPVMFLFLSVASFAAEPGGASAPKPPASAALKLTEGAMPIEKQLQLSFDLYLEMSKAEIWDIDLFKADHRRVIDECPDTPAAIESCWRLSNIYLTGQPEPDYGQVISLMEYALSKYPGNPWSERFTNRLVSALEDAGEYGKLLQFCDTQLRTRGLPEESFLAYALQAGRAAEELGQEGPASQYYSQVIERDAGTGSIFAKIARQNIERMGQPSGE